MSNTFSYKAIIVDDNEIDRLSTKIYAKKYEFLEIVGSFTNALDALAYLKNNKVDVLLLDIDMDDMTGLELRKILGNDHACIFITSYPDYALESFELAAFDFLVKPLDKERFGRTMERLQTYLTQKTKADLYELNIGGDAVFIKDGNQKIKINLQEVIYLEALKDYTRIVTPQKKYCVLGMLGNLLQEDAFKLFTRIHRSYAVQKNFVNKFSSSEVWVNDFILPIGRSYKGILDGKLN